MELSPKAPSSNKMVTLCPSVMIKFKEGDIFSFGSWVGLPSRSLPSSYVPRPESKVPGATPTRYPVHTRRREAPEFRPATTPSHPGTRLPSELRITATIYYCLTTGQPIDAALADQPPAATCSSSRTSNLPQEKASPRRCKITSNSAKSSGSRSNLPRFPFGLKNAGQIYQRACNIHVMVDSYNDDVDNPERELYAGAGGSDHINRRLANAFEEERGSFATPTANIVKAKHLLEGVEDHPMITAAKDLLEVAAIQTDKLDPLQSMSHTAGGSRIPTSAAPAKGVPNMKTPPYDLRGKLKQKDARNRLDQMRRERDAKYDGICAFTNDIWAYKYPAGFKASVVDKYDGNSNPNLWLRRYSAAIKASGGDDRAKLLYFAVAMEASPLTWLEALPERSIESWHALKKEFVNNFQGSADHLGTKYDLATCKQKPDESLRIHDCYEFRQFCRNKPKTLEELRDLIDTWADAEDEEQECFGRRNRGGINNADCKPQDGKQHQDSYSRNQGNSQKQQTGEMVDTLQKAPKKATSQQRKEEFEKLLYKHCPLHPEGKHAIYV
nr:unnamed protein product [Digitaria exilis]